MGKKIQTHHYQLILISCMQIMAKVHHYDEKTFSMAAMRYFCDNVYNDYNIAYAYALILSLQPPLDANLEGNFGTEKVPLYLKDVPNDWRKFHIISPDYLRKGKLVFDGRALPDHVDVKKFCKSADYKIYFE